MGDYSSISNLVKKQFTRYIPENSKVLELGCGTGNILQSLSTLNKNYSFVGVDISPGMVNIARKKLPNVQFFTADMTTFHISQQVDCVICIFDSINHLTSFSKWQKLFKITYTNLKKNGVFIFDMNTVKRMEYLSTMPPYVKKLNKNTIACTKITKSAKFVYRGTYQFFSHIDKDSIQYTEEVVDESAFELEQVKESLEQYFTVMKMIDPVRKRVTKNSGRVFFVCRAK